MWNPNKKKPKGYRDLSVDGRAFWYDPRGVKIVDVETGAWVIVDQADLKGVSQHDWDRLMRKGCPGILPSEISNFISCQMLPFDEKKWRTRVEVVR